MSNRDYQVHVVSESVAFSVRVGQAYAGGIIITGTSVVCSVTGKYLLMTYHGPEGEPEPAILPGLFMDKEYNHD